MVSTGTMNSPRHVAVLVVLLLFTVVVPTVTARTSKFAIISDTHVGESAQGDANVRLAVSQLNAIADEISMVLITGDLTVSALPSEYELADEMLSELRVPFYPLLGNHDVIQYTRPTNWSSWQEPSATGDHLFMQQFRRAFERSSAMVTHRGFDPVWDPTLGRNSTLVNFEVRVGALALLCVDFVSRHNATNPKDYLKGAEPTANLNDFPGGTLDWIRGRLRVIARDPSVRRVALMHHHNIASVPSFLPDYFSFDHAMRSTFAQLLLESEVPLERFVGSFVGHLHFSDEHLLMFDSYQQWVITAAKDQGAASIVLVEVDHDSGDVLSVVNCCGESFVTKALLYRAMLECISGLMIGVAMCLVIQYTSHLNDFLAANAAIVSGDHPNGSELWAKYSLQFWREQLGSMLLIGVALIGRIAILPALHQAKYFQTMSAMIVTNFSVYIAAAVVILHQASSWNGASTSVVSNGGSSSGAGRHDAISRQDVIECFMMLIAALTIDLTRATVRTEWQQDRDAFEALALVVLSVLAAIVMRELFLLRRVVPRTSGTNICTSSVLHNVWCDRAMIVILCGAAGFVWDSATEYVNLMLYRMLLPITIDLWRVMLIAAILGYIVIAMVYLRLVAAVFSNFKPLVGVSFMVAFESLLSSTIQFGFRSANYPLPLRHVSIMIVALIAMAIGASALLFRAHPVRRHFVFHSGAVLPTNRRAKE
mgnify:FL=1